MIALQTLISFSLLLLVVYLYNRYRIDRLRDDLFALREELFDLAASGAVSFESPGYRYARQTCNGLVRFSHEINLLDFFMFRLLSSSGEIDRVREDFQRQLSAMSAADRELYEKYLGKANKLVVVHLFTSPLFLVLVFPPLVACFATAKLVKTFSGALRELDTIAVFEAKRGSSKLKTI